MRFSPWRAGGALLGILTLVGGIAALGALGGPSRPGDRVVDPGPVTDHCPTLECQPDLAPASADGSAAD